MAKKEYIELDAVLSAIMCEPPDAHYPSWYAGKIEEIPAADVVEVVRCRDCIKNPNYKRKKGMVWCRKFRADVHEDHYCSYGERKEQT